MTDFSETNDNKNLSFLIKYMIRFIFFVGSFVLIFWHEGNVSNDISVYADRSSDAALANPALDSNADASSITDLTDDNAIPLNFLSGKLSSESPIGMDALLDGQYVAVRRVVEMYSWKSNPKHFESGDTQYSYTTQWTETPDEDIDDEQHINPNKTLESKLLVSRSLNIKGVEINRRTVILDDDKIWSDVKTNSDKYIVGTAEHFSNDGAYFYQNNKDKPSVGDIRIKYQVIPTSKIVTIFGVMDNDTLIKHNGKQGRKLFKLFEGNKKAAVRSLRSDTFLYTMWGIRIFATIIMILGVKMIIPSIASTIKSSAFFADQKIVVPNLPAFITTIIIATVAIASASYRHNITDLIGLGFLLIILLFTIIILANKIAYNQTHGDDPTFEVVEGHNEEGQDNGENQAKKALKKKKEPPKPIDMISKEELGVDDMSITLSSGEVVDENGHGILPADMPQAGVGQPVNPQPILEESSEPVELTLGEAVKPTPKKPSTPPAIPVDGIIPEEPVKPKSLFDSDES